ncbi:hypothetical protein SEUCBS139899_001871 [Sporothrix eucalyptigena]|uniref:CENP-V/GFA domain-containing protein n=1 Tax=Sporothrix eucalyptigena TaxID=1812306 RepID=A0ABP0C104_9PEZI
MITSSCHCGRVRITVPGPPEFRNDCRCTVCYKYGANWGYYIKKDVTITIQGKETSAADLSFSKTTPLDGLDLYIRNINAEPTTTGNAARGHLAFNRCAHCGCMTHWIGILPDQAVDPNAQVGVNTRLMDEADLQGVEQRVSTEPL